MGALSAGYSTLEVDHSKHLPEVYGENLPQADHRLQPHEYPEAISSPPSFDRTSPEVVSQEPRRICGLRRKPFWTIFALIAIILIAAAVGVGVGVSTAHSNSEEQATAESSSGSSSSNSSASDSTNSSVNANLLYQSQLAAINYTDGSGVEHYQVVFQGELNVLYQSLWNSSSDVWRVTAITTKDQVSNADADLDVREATPLAVTMYWHSKNYMDIHVYYLNSDNEVKLVSTNTNSPEGPFGEGSVGSIYKASSTSQLLAYSRLCEFCFDSNFFMYQDADSLQEVRMTTSGRVQQAVSQDTVGGAATVVNGTALAVLPIKDDGYEVAIFSNIGSIQELYYNFTWSFEHNLAGTVNSSAKFAAFTFGWDNSTNNWENSVLLVTDPENGGVTANNLVSGSWESTTPAGLANFTADSPIAATGAGRVYGIVGSEGNQEIMEWAYNADGSYTQVGSVKTTLS